MSPITAGPGTRTSSNPELRLIPVHAVPWRVGCGYSEGDFAAAEAAYRTALAAGVELPKAAARFAGLRARAFSEAESLLAVATQSPSAPPAAWKALAEARVRLGDINGAREALQSSGMGRERSKKTSPGSRKPICEPEVLRRS